MAQVKQRSDSKSCGANMAKSHDVKPEQKRLDTWQQGRKAYISALRRTLVHRQNKKIPGWEISEWSATPTAATVMIMMI